MTVSLRAPVLAIAALAALAGGPGVLAPAAAGEPNPLARFLEAAHVGPGEEFRLVVVHPVYVPQATPADVPALAASAAPEGLGVATRARGGRTAARIENLGTAPLWVLPGDVVRLAEADYAVRSDAVLAAGEATDAEVVRTSASPAEETPREEPRLAGALPGPGLLWTLLSGAKEKVVVATAADFAREADLATPRRSPIELAGGPRIAARVREYVAALRKLPTTTAAAGRRELAGFAVVIDGSFAGLEVFADAKRFQALWPRRLEGVAVEAAVLEAETELLERELAPPTDPDRFTGRVKESVLGLYGLDPKPGALRGLGTVLPLRRDPDLGRAVVHPAAGPLHLVWVRDPARRDATDSDDDPAGVGPLSRRQRLTAWERRWLERRQRGE